MPGGNVVERMAMRLCRGRSAREADRRPEPPTTPLCRGKSAHYDRHHRRNHRHADEGRQHAQPHGQQHADGQIGGGPRGFRCHLPPTTINRDLQAHHRRGALRPRGFQLTSDKRQSFHGESTRTRRIPGVVPCHSGLQLPRDACQTVTPGIIQHGGDRLHGTGDRRSAPHHHSHQPHQQRLGDIDLPYPRPDSQSTQSDSDAPARRYHRPTPCHDA